MSNQRAADNTSDNDADESDNEFGEIDEDDKIVINVGGIRYETLLHTLSRLPRSRLSYVAKRHVRGRKKEYFFDRHPAVFAAVLDFYRTGG